jgi:hypothetical protein
LTPHDKTQATTTERSARRAVNWATVVAVSLLWLLFAFWGHALHTNNRHATEQVLDIQRAAIAEQVNGVFRTTETFLAAANRWVADNPLRDPHTDPTFVQLVRDFQQVTNEAMLVRLVDADGTLHLVPSVSGAKPSKVADRDYFKAAMENPPGSISISAPFQGRSTGRWAIAVATRLTAPSHGLAVVFVAIDMTLIDDSFNKSRLQNGGSISLVRRDGVLLARSAAQRGELGIDMSRSVLFTEGLQNADEGVLFTEAKQTDKVPKLIAYGVGV